MTTGTKTVGSDPNGYSHPPSTVYLYSIKTWTGVDGRIKGNGAIKENPWSMNLTIKTGKSNPSGNVILPGGNESVDAPWNSNDTNRLNGNLIAAINGHQLQLGVAIAEGRKTIEMVYGNISTISRVLRDVKRGDFASAKRLLAIANTKAGRNPRKDPQVFKNDLSFKSKIVANRWLELQYGWLPLLSDVYEGMKAYAVLTEPRRVWRIKAAYNKPEVVRNTSVNVNFNGTIKYKKRTQETGRIIYELTEDLSLARSLGLMNPEAVLWEIVPWSFVIDWFIPIGTYLTNLNTVPKLTGEVVMTRFYRFKAVGTPQGENNVYKGSTGVLEQIAYTRTVSVGLVSKFPQFVGLEQALSPKRMWNALALATQQVTRKPF